MLAQTAQVNSSFLLGTLQSSMAWHRHPDAKVHLWLMQSLNSTHLHAPFRQLSSFSCAGSLTYEVFLAAGTGQSDSSGGPFGSFYKPRSNSNVLL